MLSPWGLDIWGVMQLLTCFPKQHPTWGVGQLIARQPCACPRPAASHRKPEPRARTKQVPLGWLTSLVSPKHRGQHNSPSPHLEVLVAFTASFWAASAPKNSACWGTSDAAPHQGGLRTLGLLQPFLTPRQHLRVSSHLLLCIKPQEHGHAELLPPADAAGTRGIWSQPRWSVTRPFPGRNTPPAAQAPPILTFGLL